MSDEPTTHERLQAIEEKLDLVLKKQDGLFISIRHMLYKAFSAAMGAAKSAESYLAGEVKESEP